MTSQKTTLECAEYSYDFCLALAKAMAIALSGWDGLAAKPDAVRKLQPTKSGELRSPLIQRDGGFATGVAILDSDQAIRKVSL